MSRVLCIRKRAALRGTGWPGRLAGAVLLALALGVFAGVGQAWAAPRLPNAVATVTFIAPNYRGLIGGPPGTRVTVKGYSWLPYATVSLSLSLNPWNCYYTVPVGTYQTANTGTFTARFLWPAAANTVAPYYACAIQRYKGTALSRNSFTVLASSPASLSFSASTVTAGGSVTITGRNWLPGQQTVTIVVLPCNTVCQAEPVADAQVVSDSNGAFSQPMTILAGATSGKYYAQATNTAATLAAISAPIQVAGQATPGGTPLPGSSPTTSATRTSSGAGAVQPPSQTKAALKDALLAAGLGLVALVLLLVGIALLIARQHHAEPAVSKAGGDKAVGTASPTPVGQASWRTAGAASWRTREAALSEAQVQEVRQPEMLQPWRSEQVIEERDTVHLSVPAIPWISMSHDTYPSEQPATPDTVVDSTSHTLTDRRPNWPATRGSAAGFVQRILSSQPPVDEQEDE